MENYPDDILNHTCPHCKEITPNCVCDEVAAEKRYEDALHGDDEKTYYEMFDSGDSDDLVAILRNLHREPSEDMMEKLVEQLDLMLLNHVEN